MKKGHNFGLCKKCGKEHIHPRGTLGKHLVFTDLEERRIRARINGKKRLIQFDKDDIEKIIYMYQEEQLSIYKISYVFGVSTGPIHRVLLENDVFIRSRYIFPKGHKLYGGRPFRKGEPSIRLGKKNKVKCDNCDKFFPRCLCLVGKRNFCSKKCFNEYKAKNILEYIVFNSPNKGESEFLQILRSVDDNWRYVGNGSLIISGKKPDYWNGDNLLIDLFGGSWHRRDEEVSRIEFFKSHGFLELIIWYSEMRKPEILKEKVRKWMKESSE